MTHIRRSSLIIAALATTLVMIPPPGAHADSFGVYVGSNGFGLSLGFGDWGVWGASWSDPYWNVDYDGVLSGYGEWVWVNGLGRVWRPYVAADWRPYTYGRWVYSDLGWTWVSYEPWGYFPHHYGEWALTSFGWTWVPGYVYRPAHVVWVTHGGYVGWYPRAPHGWSHASRGYWRGYDRGYHHGYDRGYDNGYWDGWRDARYATYVPWKEMTSDNVSRHAATRTSVSRASVMTLREAPSQTEISRRSGRPVPKVTMSQRQAKVGERTVTVARPEGVARSVESNARETVRRALAPSVSERIESRSTSRAIPRGKDSPASSGRSVSVERQASPSQHSPATRTQTRTDHSSASASTSPRGYGRDLVQPKGTPSTSASESAQSAPQRRSAPSRTVSTGRSTASSSKAPAARTEPRSQTRSRAVASPSRTSGSVSARTPTPTTSTRSTTARSAAPSERPASKRAEAKESSREREADSKGSKASAKQTRSRRR